MLNKTESYETNIRAKVEELKKACYEAGIPMFFSCAIADDGTHTVYKNEMVSPLSVNTALSEDLIADFVIVINGGVTHAEELEEVDF